jgi:hypothetical protein
MRAMNRFDCFSTAIDSPSKRWMMQVVQRPICCHCHKPKLGLAPCGVHVCDDCVRRLDKILDEVYRKTLVCR